MCVLCCSSSVDVLCAVSCVLRTRLCRSAQSRSSTPVVLLPVQTARGVAERMLIGFIESFSRLTLLFCGFACAQHQRSRHAGRHRHRQRGAQLAGTRGAGFTLRVGKRVCIERTGALWLCGLSTRVLTRAAPQPTVDHFARLHVYCVGFDDSANSIDCHSSTASHPLAASVRRCEQRRCDRQRDDFRVCARCRRRSDRC